MDAVNTKDEMQALKQIEELRQDAKSSKNRHFAAAERYGRYHNVCGTLTLLIEIVLFGALLFALVEVPSSLVLRLAVAVASLIVIFLTGFQTKFGFDQQAEQHRNMGNRYLAVVVKCKRLLGRHQDLQSNATELWTELDAIREEYMLINQEAGKWPTSAKDDEEAKENEKKQRTPFASLES